MLLDVPAGVAALKKKQPHGEVAVPKWASHRVKKSWRCQNHNQRKRIVPGPDEKPPVAPKLKAQETGARVQGPAPAPVSTQAPSCRRLRDCKGLKKPARYAEVSSTAPAEPSAVASAGSAALASVHVMGGPSWQPVHACKKEKLMHFSFLAGLWPPNMILLRILNMISRVAASLMSC